MLKDTINKETGKYEVKAFGLIHKFDTWEEAQEYINEVEDWCFTDDCDDDYNDC